jgi:hypothetical protein
MRAYLILILLITVSSMSIANAKIVSNSDSSLDHDLNYMVDDQEDSKRDIASEEEESKQEVDGDRDIANDADENSNSIKYWKY